jgi:hypothetical protein
MSLIMANIKIPIELKDDTTITPMIEYISIDIEKCENLPEKVEISNVQKDFFEKIKSILTKESQITEKNENIHENEDENIVENQPDKLKILPHEIKKPKNIHKSNNITLKNYSEKSKTRYRNTMKNYSD